MATHRDEEIHNTGCSLTNETPIIIPKQRTLFKFCLFHWIIIISLAPHLHTKFTSVVCVERHGGAPERVPLSVSRLQCAECA